MLVETVFGIFVLIGLVCFVLVNLHNILVVHELRGKFEVYAEVERPSGFAVTFAGLGTLAYFLEVIAYLSLVFTGFTTMLYTFPVYLQLPPDSYLQSLGLSLTLAGYSLFIWSVIARGRYAVSWRMPESQKLVTWGPYKYIRHPSYAGYFLMFFGLFFLWSNLLTLLPIFAIVGYYHVTIEEEQLLAKRFGDEYLNYQKKTGRFAPKL